MALPQKVTAVLFPTGAPRELCGIGLGDRFSALSLPAFWSDSHSEGKVRFGCLDVAEGGISKVTCSVTDTLGRVSHVQMSLELESEGAEKQVFRELGEVFTRRCGKGTRAKKTVEWPVAGALEGRLDVRNASFTMQGERVYRVEVTLYLGPGVEIVADT